VFEIPTREEKGAQKAIVPNLIFRSFYFYFLLKTKKSLILVLLWCKSVSYVGRAPIFLICFSSCKIIYTIFPMTFLASAHLRVELVGWAHKISFRDAGFKVPYTLT
jgi:hypothetical protein